MTASFDRTRAGTDPILGPDCFWYAKLPSNPPLNPHSADLAREFLRQKACGDDNIVALNTTQWTSPVYIAADGTEPIDVGVNRCLSASDEDYASLAEQFENVPIPSYVQPSPDDDAEMTVYDQSTDTMWEFYEAQNKDGAWQACWGGRMADVSQNSEGIWPNPFGATATGLPLVGGQITAEELSAGAIEHVMGIALVQSASGTYSWPATRTDGPGCAGKICIPQGLRFRLNPTIDIGTLDMPPAGKIIAKTAQDYGFVVWDTAGTTSLRCKNPLSYTLPNGIDPYPGLFAPADEDSLLNGFPWSALQFLPQDYGRPRSDHYQPAEIERKSKQVDELLDRWLSKAGPGAAVMVIQDHEILHQKGYGQARLGPQGCVGITPSTNFRLASLTKQFTAMAIAILLERGKLRLHDRLVDFFPCQAAKEIEVHHLLHHTSGLAEFDQLFLQLGMIDTLGFRSASSPPSFFAPTNRDVLAVLERQPLLSAPPGAAFSYSNSGYACLASIIEKASDMKYADFLAAEIFLPLGMTHTFVADTPTPSAVGVAQSYDFAGVATGIDIDYSPLNRVFGEDGVFTNLEDLYQWDATFYRAGNQSVPPRTLVSDAMLDLIFTRGHLNDGSSIDPGFGWFITPDGTMAAHSGGWAGYRTYIRRYLQHPFTIVVLSNYAALDVVAIADGIDDIYYPPSVSRGS
jgi:CubicO group peptidase (beta-lactamase class C family)